MYFFKKNSSVFHFEFEIRINMWTVARRPRRDSRQCVARQTPRERGITYEERVQRLLRADEHQRNRVLLHCADHPSPPNLYLASRLGYNYDALLRLQSKETMFCKILERMSVMGVSESDMLSYEAHSDSDDAANTFLETEPGERAREIVRLRGCWI